MSREGFVYICTRLSRKSIAKEPQDQELRKIKQQNRKAQSEAIPRGKTTTQEGKPIPSSSDQPDINKLHTVGSIFFYKKITIDEIVQFIDEKGERDG